MGQYAAFWGCFIQGRFPFIERSLRLTLDHLGVSYTDLDGFTCCPEKSLILNESEDAWLLTAARNLSLADEAGVDIFSPCNGCVGTLKGARQHLLTHPDLLRKVTKKLDAIGHTFTGHARVLHLIELLHDQIGADVIRRKVAKPLTGMRVAVHAGCHQMRPAAEVKVDNPMNPSKFEALVAALGAEVVDYPSKLLCCGGAMNTAGLVDAAREMTREKLRELSDMDVDVLVVVCPACFMQYDIAQLEMAREGQHYNVPVAVLSELMALAFGLPLEELGLDMHRIPVEATLQEWVEEVAAPSEIEDLDLAAMETCIECQACSRNCAVCKMEPDFSPWDIFQRVLDGDLEGALHNPGLFKCVECYECQERCFQRWGMIRGLRALKHLAIERGLAPDAVRAGIEAFTKTGLLTQPSAARRKRLGLPPASKPGVAELQALLGREGAGEQEDRKARRKRRASSRRRSGDETTKE